MLTLRVLALASLGFAGWAQDQQSASLGDFKLRGGETIRDLKVGYRTFGTLNADKSNAILFPTWFTGTTKNLADLIGPGKLIDPAKYFVIAADALGDGVSSSASKKLRAAAHVLPEVLYARHGRVNGRHANFRMDGCLSNFMDFAIPIVGSPKLTSYDLLLWNAEAHAIETDPSWKNGEYTQTPAGMKIVADIHSLAINTPDYWVEHVPPSGLPAKMAEDEKTTASGFDCNNWLRQLQAMIGHDISRSFDGDMAKAASAVHAKTLVIVGTEDHMVNPHPALDFAKLIKARTIELGNNCGHTSPACDMAKIGPEISSFLDTK